MGHMGHLKSGYCNYYIRAGVCAHMLGIRQVNGRVRHRKRLFWNRKTVFCIPKAWDENEEALYGTEEAPHVRKEAPHVAKEALFWRKSASFFPKKGADFVPALLTPKRWP